MGPNVALSFNRIAADCCARKTKATRSTDSDCCWPYLFIYGPSVRPSPDYFLYYRHELNIRRSVVVVVVDNGDPWTLFNLLFARRKWWLRENEEFRRLSTSFPSWCDDLWPLRRRFTHVSRLYLFAHIAYYSSARGRLSSLKMAESRQQDDVKGLIFIYLCDAAFSRFAAAAPPRPPYQQQ